MERIVKCGLIQAKCEISGKESVSKIKKYMIDKHLKLIDKAVKKGVQIVCLQEVFYGPYFPAEQEMKWYEAAEKVSEDSATLKPMINIAKKNKMVMVIPIYEEVMKGVYYNTSVVIDADGMILGTYRKTHIPQLKPGFWEKFYFKPGNSNYPVFDTKYAKIGVFTCYDRHFPECARILGLKGAEIVFNPSATVAGLSEYLWKIEQPAHAVFNQIFIGAVNRVGWEEPWRIGEFYGQSYFCDPKGQIISMASRDKDEVLISDLNLDMILEVRNIWQYFRDRRPETYNSLIELIP